MKKTVFAHILNEEYLLPGWLTHHKKLFTHGVICDCGSTDKSLQIIKEICPTWEIIKLTQHEMRSPDAIALEKTQELESKADGWKCILNVTEYLVIDDLTKYLTNFEKNYPNLLGVRATGIIIVDRPGQISIDQYPDPNILAKKDFGYLEAGKSWTGQRNPDGTFQTTNTIYRSRLIHKNKTGLYTSGRHNTHLPVHIDKDLYLAWIGRGSPELYRFRWIMLKSPPSGVYFWAGINNYDVATEKEGEYTFWKSELLKSVNLFETVPNYKKYLDILYGKEVNQSISNIDQNKI